MVGRALTAASRRTRGAPARGSIARGGLAVAGRVEPEALLPSANRPPNTAAEASATTKALRGQGFKRVDTARGGCYRAQGRGHGDGATARA